MAKISQLPLIDPRGDEDVVLAIGAQTYRAHLSDLLNGAVTLTSSTKNKFDPDAVLDGFEVSGNDPEGSSLPYPTSQLSGWIPVRGQGFIVVSGLPENTAGGNNYDRQHVFFGLNGAVVVHGFTAWNATTFLLAVPEEAYGFRFSVSQRNGLNQDNSRIQVEYGRLPTAHQPFAADLVARVGGRELHAQDRPLITYVGGPEQLFDASQVRDGVEVYGDGRLVPQPDSNAILIYVADYVGHALAISGLQPAVTPRFYNFHSSRTIDEATRISGGTLASEDAGGIVVVPEGAEWLALSPRQRSSSPPAFGDVVVCEGSTPAAGPVAFSRRVRLIDGDPVDAGGGLAAPVRFAGAGKSASFFGDSRWQTNNVEGGSYRYPDGTRPNPLDIIQARLRFDAAYNFALSGAMFAQIPAGQSPFQRINHQIDAWLGHGAASGPALVGIAGGTNDIGTALGGDTPGYGGFGTVEAAMTKSLYVDQHGDVQHDLDLSVTAEAARLVFWRVQRAEPRANKFYHTPAQRGDWSYAQMAPLVDILARLAAIYGFTVVDCFRRLPILNEFEGGTISASVDGTTMTVSASRTVVALAPGNVVFGHPNLRTDTRIVEGPSAGRAGTYTLDTPAISPIAANLRIRGGRFLPDGLHSGTNGHLVEAELVLQDYRRCLAD